MSDTISAGECDFSFPGSARLDGIRASMRRMMRSLRIARGSHPGRGLASREVRTSAAPRLADSGVKHRLVNSLQIIVNLLSLQSRTAGPEAAAQLTIAANRVASFGRVHLGLHLLDHQESVHFNQYLQHLCDDLRICCLRERPHTRS